MTDAGILVAARALGAYLVVAAVVLAVFGAAFHRAFK